MSIEEIKSTVDKMATAFENLKEVNERKFKEIEKKGSADPLTEKAIERINGEISQFSEIKSRLDKIETSSAGSLGEEKSSNAAIEEYKAGFLNYARKGVEAGLEALELKTLSVGSDPDGGYTVTPVMSDRIIKNVFETSPMRQVAAVETISSDSLQFIVDIDEATSGGWTGETGAVSDTDTPQFAKKTIMAHEQYAQPKATQKLLDDSAINIESWLANKVSEIFSRQENTAFFTGNGVDKPRGILTYPTGTAWEQIEQISSTSGTGAVLSGDDLIKLFYGLKEDYEANASFLMNRATVEATRLLKSTDNQYLWKPGLDAGAPDTILNKPIIQCSDMPVLATDSLSIACGDFSRGYQIVDRIGIRTLRDPFTQKPFVKFYTTKRVGGDVANFEAIKLLKMDA